MASVTSGVLFSYASIIFGEFYCSGSKEPCKTRIIKLSQKIKHSTVYKKSLFLQCSSFQFDVNLLSDISKLCSTFDLDLTLKSVTPDPTVTTSPAASKLSTYGNFCIREYMPCLAINSAKLMPHARIWTRTWR